MKRKLILTATTLVLSLLLSSCAAVGRNPVKHAWPRYTVVNVSSLSMEGLHLPAATSCQVHAVDLIGAWVAAGSPEKDAFSFTDVNGKSCKGTFEADVQPLFNTSNLWYPGAPSCRTCHGADVNISYARMDLSNFQGIMAGMARESAQAKGDDILGGGDWQKADLQSVLTSGRMPPDKPSGLDPKGPLIAAGSSQ